MKKLVPALCLALLLTACATPQAGESPTPTPAIDTMEDWRRGTYRAAMEGFLLRQEFPDGTPMELKGDGGERLEENRFAVLDIDGDGGEKLLVLITTPCVAGKLGLIYRLDPDTGGVQEVLRAFSALTVYTNGAIREDWTDAPAGDGDGPWPYTLYRWDAEGGRYENRGTADCLDKTLRPESFPEELDEDGDGRVYYLTFLGEDPVDGAEYARWRQETLGEGEPLELELQPWTQETVEANAP